MWLAMWQNKHVFLVCYQQQVGKVYVPIFHPSAAATVELLGGLVPCVLVTQILLPCCSAEVLHLLLALAWQNK
jgi:hypothetical protein